MQACALGRSAGPGRAAATARRAPLAAAAARRLPRRRRLLLHVCRAAALAADHRGRPAAGWRRTPSPSCQPRPRPRGRRPGRHRQPVGLGAGAVLLRGPRRRLRRRRDRPVHPPVQRARRLARRGGGPGQGVLPHRGRRLGRVRDGATRVAGRPAAMALVTLRHLEDYAYVHRLRLLAAAARRTSCRRRAARPRPDGGPDRPAPPPSRRAAGRLLGQEGHAHAHRRALPAALPGPADAAAHARAVGDDRRRVIAVVWTQGGRTAKALLVRDGPDLGRCRPTGWGHLDHQLDLGPLARAPARLGAARSGLDSSAPPCSSPPAARSLAGPAAVGGRGRCRAVRCWSARGASRPCTTSWAGRRRCCCGWPRPAVGSWSTTPPARMSAAAFAYLAAVACHRYDVVYRLRDTGQPPGAGSRRRPSASTGGSCCCCFAALLRPPSCRCSWWPLRAVLVYPRSRPRAGAPGSRAQARLAERAARS